MWPLLRILLLGVMVREGLTRRVEWADGDTIIVEGTHFQLSCTGRLNLDPVTLN